MGGRSSAEQAESVNLSADIFNVSRGLKSEDMKRSLNYGKMHVQAKVTVVCNCWILIRFGVSGFHSPLIAGVSTFKL